MSSVGRRLAGFALVLVLAFSAAYAVGEAWPGGDDAPAPAHDQHDGTDMGGMDHGTAP